MRTCELPEGICNHFRAPDSLALRYNIICSSAIVCVHIPLRGVMRFIYYRGPVTSVLRQNSPSQKCFLFAAFRFLTGMTVASHPSAGSINHFAPVFLLPVISGRFYCLSELVSPTLAGVARRTIVSITSDNYARMHSSPFAKQPSADNSDAFPPFGFSSFYFLATTG